MITETDTLKEQDILQELETKTKILAEFYADRCPHCVAMEKIIQKLSQDSNICPIIKINVDSMPSIAQKYSVRSIPTFILFKNGVEVSKKVGQVTQKTLEEMISEF